jgi:preprotein translocase subunit YajC
MFDIVAQENGAGGFSFLIFLLPIGLLFFLMRSQRRRVQEQQNVQQAVDVGDEVLTSSGMFGTVVDIEEDDTLWVEVSPGTRVHMIRGGIARRLTEEDVYEDDDEAYGDDEGATDAP